MHSTYPPQTSNSPRPPLLPPTHFPRPPHWPSSTTANVLSSDAVKARCGLWAGTPLCASVAFPWVGANVLKSMFATVLDWPKDLPLKKNLDAMKRRHGIDLKHFITDHPLLPFGCFVYFFCIHRIVSPRNSSSLLLLDSYIVSTEKKNFHGNSFGCHWKRALLTQCQVCVIGSVKERSFMKHRSSFHGLLTNEEILISSLIGGIFGRDSIQWKYFTGNGEKLSYTTRILQAILSQCLLGPKHDGSPKRGNLNCLVSTLWL